jgi:hypothetical protein
MNYKPAPLSPVQLKPEIKERMEILKKELREYSKKYDEDHKDVKCCFWGCELWSDCSKKCHGTVYDHVKSCGSWWYGYMYGCCEKDGTLDDRS